MLSAIFKLLAAATAAFAIPASPRLNAALVPQAVPGPWCKNFGGGGFDVAFNFSLSAFNSTLDLEGEPLVFGQAGAVDGAEFKVFSTFASFPFNDFPTLSLNQGILKPDGDVSASNSGVADGTEPTFVFTTLDLPPPAQIWCGVASTSAHGGGTGNPQLAVNGDVDSFSLCRTGDQPTAQVNVVYKATADNFGAYIFDSCFPVKLEMVGLLD
ncbi:hypothetical protein BXZ70DRAFT_1004894 [Cristinia sonorae]|uniref:Uncharacterized protein n=1 Tax=Cristinia sonorae TaxID=1940300 RepID=A0A8K0UWT5_9AGAR|nr:hypothetical protein BXZ70DRAFT_1004894 [Cristinia sonorae]